MLPVDDLWLMEDPPIDEPADVLTIPEVKQHVVHDHHDDDLGLRSLLERPETLSKSWWRKEHRLRRASSKTTRRQPATLRAA